MPTIVDLLFTGLAAVRWLPRLRLSQGRVTVPPAPIDLDQLLGALRDRHFDDDDDVAEVEQSMISDYLLGEGLLQEEGLWTLDWIDGTYAVNLLAGRDGIGYLTLPLEPEGATWPWIAIARIKPGESAELLTATIVDFIDSRGANYGCAGFFPGIYPGGKSIISQRVDQQKVLGAISRWKDAGS